MWPNDFFPNQYFTGEYWPKAPGTRTGHGGGIGRKDRRHLLWRAEQDRIKLDKERQAHRTFLRKLIHKDDAHRLLSMQSPLSNQTKLANATSSFAMMMSEI